MDIKRTFFTEEKVEELYKNSEGGLTLEALGELFAKDLEENMTRIGEEERVDVGEILEPYKGCESVEEVTEKAKKILAKDLGRAKGGTNVVMDLMNSGVFVGLKVAEEGLLKAEEEKKYREQWETMVLGHFAAAPVLTGERLLALFEAGRVKIIKVFILLFFFILFHFLIFFFFLNPPSSQSVQNVSSTATSCTIHHGFGKEEAKYVVNTTGFIFYFLLLSYFCFILFY